MTSNEAIVRPKATIANQEHGIWYVNNNLNIVFKPSQQVSKTILHFSVDGGCEQNMDMPKDNNTFNFAINNIHQTNKVSYSFTYFTQNCAVDSQWFTNQNTPQPPAPVAPIQKKNDDDNWVTVFFDDFNGPLDRSKWTPMIDASGMGNQELQSYVDQPNTVYTENSCLVLQCNKEKSAGRDFTSGRVDTKGKFSSQYGKWEAKMKLPAGAPMWCAFWLLCAPPNTRWCIDGIEIDIMECVGRTCNKPTGAINFSDKGWPHNRFVYETYEFKDTDASKDFHIYSIIWDPDRIRWFVDGNLYSTKTADDLKPDSWNCAKPYFIIVNNAIGGLLGKSVHENDVFPQKMYIDWVKVSQWKM